MKKVPSYPKITSKTNITVTQTQNININSPKAILQKKGFKNQSKKIKISALPVHVGMPMPMPMPMKNESGVNLLKSDIKKCIEPTRKNSKKLLKQSKDKDAQEREGEKTIKNSKSQRQLAVLSEKLKKLQQKINKIKQKQKVEKAKENSSASHRSFSKNRQNSSYVKIKRQATSSRKQLSTAKKYHISNITKADSHKVLKKSYSDKLGFQVPKPSSNSNNRAYNTRIKGQIHKSRKQQKSQTLKQLSLQKQKHDQQILHQLVTQVPNAHPHPYSYPNDANLKESVQKSLVNGNFVMTPSNQSQQQQDEQQLYYIGKAIKSLVRPALFPIRQHLIQSLQTLQFLHNIKKPSLKEIEKKQVHLPPAKFRQTIILDLDETLIHCNETLHVPHDVKLSIKFPTGEKIDAGVNIRPHAKHFLQELSKICEVIVFTASHECYATVVLDHLDPKKQLISHRLFREHCWQTEQGVYIKDLRVLKNRSMQNMILVDNAAYSYYFQLQNGVPIIPYYDDKDDRQLLTLLEYIKQTIISVNKIKDAKDSKEKGKISLKNLNQNYFRLMDYAKFEDIGPLVEELYNNNTDSSSHDNNHNNYKM